MARKAFYSFHYHPDNWRASKVRNIGVIEGNGTVSDNDWETITSGGDAAIERWILGQMRGRSCTIVLVGEMTAGRKWINYEIKESWNAGMGVFGIRIHNLTDRNEETSARGGNPFDAVTLSRDGTKLSSIVPLLNPPYTVSGDVYNHIRENLEDWVEEAIAIRTTFR